MTVLIEVIEGLIVNFKYFPCLRSLMIPHDQFIIDVVYWYHLLSVNRTIIVRCCCWCSVPCENLSWHCSRLHFTIHFQIWDYHFISYDLPPWIRWWFRRFHLYSRKINMLISRSFALLYIRNGTDNVRIEDLHSVNLSHRFSLKVRRNCIFSNF